MTHTYNISGMTCNGCVAKVKSQLLMLGDVTEVNVQLEAPQATITMQKHIQLDTLQQAVSKAGHYTISETSNTHRPVDENENRSWLSTYKPILLIGAYLIGITLLIEAARGSFDMASWMQNFMGGFFFVFSFFKLLNLQGFAESYVSYDIIAKRWHGWGYAYAFIELGLGVAFLLRLDPLLTNAAAFVVMSISIVGVLQSVLRKRKIQCACLGVVFNLPMSTITIIEDALMILMSGAMLVSML
jgi:copper chaperone CopZ